MTFAMRLALLILCLAALVESCAAQQVVAPTPEKVGPVRGDDWDGYNIVNSFETGYRFFAGSGNPATYRSNVNFGNGVRLLGSYFTANSKNGHGLLFDELVLTTEGLGGDPYAHANFRLQKNRIYEYTLLWRRSDYYNPGLVTGGGQGEHLLDTSYMLQDHDLTLFPQSRIRFFLGYARDTQGGAGISTVQLFSPNGLFDPTGNIFPVFTNLKRVENEYRLGFEVHWLGFTFNALHGWQDFKDDSADQFSGASNGDGFNPNTILNLFSRNQPYHGTSPYWRAALFRNSRLLSFNGRFTYTGGQRAFVANEAAMGISQIGTATNQQILTFGSARRPVATGNAGLSLFPTDKLSITESVSFYNVRTDGNSAYLQFDNASRLTDLLLYQYLGIRTVATQTDAIYHLKSWLDLHGGYEYSNRQIASTPQLTLDGTPATTPYLQTNALNTGSVGARLSPLKGLTISLDGEFGHADRPFTPRADKNYSALTGRVRYRYKTLQLAAWSQSDYNENSVTVSAYSSHSRTYSASGTWSPLNRIAFDAVYSKIHLDTLGGVQFFANAQLYPNQLSYYVSNLQTGTIDIHLSLLKRLDLYLGYSHVQDTGDGRSVPTATPVGSPLPAFEAAQTFPVRFLSPMGRLSVRLSERVRWNVGYQYYGYRADFWPSENYLANTGYTSVLWSF